MSESLTLRKSKLTDEKLILNWTNDQETRKWSLSSKMISTLEHHQWFERKVNSPNVLMLILERRKKPAGLARLEINAGGIVLHYLIAPDERGKGLASRLLIMAMSEKRKIWGNNQVLAYTLPNNIASIKSLEKTGFSLVSATKELKCYGAN
jgi:RimJ/RimL family protein N-acetyltransferase